MVGNLFAHIVERNPLSRASEFVFVNNVVYDRGTMDLDLQSQNGVITKIRYGWKEQRELIDDEARDPWADR